MREVIKIRSDRLSSKVKLLVLFFIWINISWISISFANSYRSAEIWIYAVLNDNPDNCENGLAVGSVSVGVDNLNVVKFTREQMYLRMVYQITPNGTWDFANYHRWWKSQLSDRTTSYCGVISSNLTENGDKAIPPHDMAKLRGTLFTFSGSDPLFHSPALKLTISGPKVKVEPVQACCSSEGECVKENVLWEGESCPAGTESAGKTSGCFRCSVKKVPSPEETPLDDGGACCFGTGYCWIETDEWCKEKKGKFMNHVQTCEPNPCPEAEIGCCSPDFTDGCDMMSLADCGLLGGEPMPSGQQCTGDIETDCNFGACMVGEECKEPSSRTHCATTYQGEYLGDGRRCPQPEPDKGACCTDDGECSLETEETCSGRFMPEVQTCDPNPCPQPEPPTGGCCNAYGDCEENITEENCTGDSTFFEGGCPENCPVEEGACYIPCPVFEDDKTCRVMKRVECEAIANNEFRLNENCPPEITECRSAKCSSCEEAFGTWAMSLPGQKGELILNAGCTSTMKTMTVTPDSADMPPIRDRAGSSMDGTWECSDNTITISWPENARSSLIMVRDGDDWKLCYKDGENLVCADYIESLNVTVKEIKKGNVPE